MTGRIHQPRSTDPQSSSKATTGDRKAVPELDTAASDFSSLMSKKKNVENVPAKPREFAEHSNEYTQSESDDKRDAGHSEEDGKSDDQSDQDSNSSLLPSPDAVLRSFIGLQNTNRTDAVNDVPPDMNAVIQQVADDVMVSDIGSREVRITIKDSILPGTEVRIIQQAGRMQVRFVTTSADSMERITTHQNLLQAALNEKLPRRDFVVSVEMDSPAFNDQRDGQSRSRQDQQQNDEDEPNED